MVTVMLTNGEKLSFNNLNIMLKNADFFAKAADSITMIGADHANEIAQITVNREILSGDFIHVISICSNLKALNLSWCNIGSSVIQSIISEIAKNLTLREVDLQGNPIGSEGALTFIPLIAEGQLTSLNLQFCGIGEAAAAVLREAAAASPTKLVLAGKVRHVGILSSYLPEFSVMREVCVPDQNKCSGSKRVTFAPGF